MKIHIQNRTGDTEMDVDVDMAKQLFQEAIDSGKMVLGEDKAGDIWLLTEFPDPKDYNRLEIAPRQAGG